jgi:hypothetical protein
MAADVADDRCELLTETLQIVPKISGGRQLVWALLNYQTVLQVVLPAANSGYFSRCDAGDCFHHQLQGLLL